MYEEISIYGRLIADLKKVSMVIEKLFPDNDSKFIETGTVFISEGNIFECSIEPLEKNHAEQLYFSANYLGDTASYESFLSSIITEFDKNEIVYTIDSEFKEGDKYFEKNIRHPDYDRLTTPS